MCIRDRLRTRQKETASKKQKQQLQEAIVAIENAHPRRPRAAYFGEMVQMDASVHLWFGEKKTNLHIAVDDSTGQMCIRDSGSTSVQLFYLSPP